MGRGFEPTPPPFFFLTETPLQTGVTGRFPAQKTIFFFFALSWVRTPRSGVLTPSPSHDGHFPLQKTEKSKNRFFGHFPLESCSGALFPFQMQHFPFQNVHIPKNPFFPLQNSLSKFFPLPPVTFSLKKNLPYQKVTISLSNSQFPYQK